LPGDANYNGTVDAGDAAILAGNWGMSGMNWGDGDFTGDGMVNAPDASILAANWGYVASETVEEVTPDVPGPSEPESPLVARFVGPVEAKRLDTARRRIEPVARSAALLAEHSAGQAAVAAREAAITAQYGPDVEAADLARARLAWSQEHSPSQIRRRSVGRGTQATLAVDAILAVGLL
jgi:hypothetical protein